MSGYDDDAPRAGGGQHHGGGQEEDLQDAARFANEDSGDSGDHSLFSSVLGRLQGQHQQIANQDLDEKDMVQQHEKIYGQGENGDGSAQSLGAAAAMQALKKFTGGSGAAQAASGGGQSAFIGMAMSEAAKLFDSKGGAANADKPEVVQQAAKYALKMYMSGGGGSGTGGLGGLGALAGNSGGLGNLMSIASKFM